MKRVSYLPHVPEDAPPPSPVTQWSYGIAMFAAFVLPFVLLLTGARYRLFADQTFLKLRGASQTESIPAPQVGYPISCAGVYRSELIDKARQAKEAQQTPAESGQSK